MNLQEERLSGKHVFKGRIIDLEVDQIQLPDGHNSIREVINHPGGVAIAALNERDELLMVRQFRYPFRTVLLERARYITVPMAVSVGLDDRHGAATRREALPDDSVIMYNAVEIDFRPSAAQIIHRPKSLQFLARSISI